MRFHALVAVGVVVLGSLAARCQTPRDAGGNVLFRHRFAGLAQVATRPDCAPLQAILDLPESKALRAGVETRLALQVPAWFGVPSRSGTNPAVELRELVQALVEHETMADVRGSGGRVDAWAVAIRLEAARAEALGTGLGRVLADLLGSPAPVAAAGGWELKTPEGRPAARFVSEGGWAVMGRGPQAFEALRGVAARRGVAAPATGEVLELKADLARLAGILGWRPEPAGPVAQWPSVSLAVEPRNGRLRTAGEFNFARPLDLSLEPWRIPTGVVRDPLVGFTAVQGAERWLSRLSLFAGLPVKEWPHQLFLWSVAGDPWQQYAAGPMRGPTNLMFSVARTLPLRLTTNMAWRGQSFALRVTNQASRVEWRGLPYLAPFLESIRQPEGEGEAIYAGLFPQVRQGPPAPEPLLNQVTGRTNLVFYDWETTGSSMAEAGAPDKTTLFGRLLQWKHLRQFAQLMLGAPGGQVPMTPNGMVKVPGGAWIDAALPRLGDTVTEVVRTGPAQLAFTRQSQVGFSALELMYLLAWLENPGFPGWNEPAPVPVPAPTPAPGGR